MAPSGIILPFAVLLSLTQACGFWMVKALERHTRSLLGLSAGMITVLLFLDMLGQVQSHASQFGDGVLLAMLCGFVLFYVLQQKVYGSTSAGSKKRRLELAYLALCAELLENFAIGFLLALLISQRGYGLALAVLFVPFMMRAFASSIHLARLAARLGLGRAGSLALCLPIFLGAVCANALALEQRALGLSFSFLIGVLLYVITRDMIPQGKNSQFASYLLGVLIGVLSFFASGM